ncbi:MAG: glycosyltransferase [Ignavibacteriaceae bacterium]
MKILIITPRIPYPPFRGDKLKIYNLAKLLSINNSVTILTFLRNNSQRKDLVNLEKHGIQIEVVKFSLFGSLLQTFLAIFGNLPFQTAFFKSSKMKKKVGEKVRTGDFDVVYYHLIRSAQYLYLNKTDSKPLNIIDFTDDVSLYLKRFAEIETNPIKRYFINIEQRRIEKYERIAEKFHSLFICSEVDKDFLKKKGINKNVNILPNGIDIDYFDSDNQEFEKNRIIFTGNMPYYANYDAAYYFTKDIFPLVLKRIPESEFYIVGQKPPPKIKMLKSKNVFVTGFVKDIKLEYIKSAVNVAPMRFGAGTLNKVIESIALGVPVVATSMAVGGLPKELNKYIFVANDPEDFAKKVIYVIQNPTIRLELMEEGKKIIREKLNWKKIVSEFEEYLSNELSKLN